MSALRQPSDDRLAYFDRIFATDLRYVPDCYTLCGDAHCCNYARYKQRFMLLGGGDHELPLMPGEFDYMRTRGYLGQFGDYKLKEVAFAIDQGMLRYQAIVSKRAGCVCDQQTRATLCRLYPLFPQYDVSGALVGVESVGIYEELERLDGLDQACRIGSIPIAEMDAFIGLATHIGSDPVAVFHMEAFRHAKAAAAASVKHAMEASGKSAFRTFELLVLRARLFDTEAIRQELSALAARFAEYHGSRFQL